MSYFEDVLSECLVESENQRKFSSTQFDIPADIIKKFVDLSNGISKSDLASDGVEDKPHVTVKYGIHTNDCDEILNIVSEFGPVTISLGEINIFENEEHDVIKVDVHGQDIHDLNRLIATSTECTDTYPEYKPHATIAYVKPGLGKKYKDELNGFGDVSITFDELTFSSKDRVKTKINLN